MILADQYTAINSKQLKQYLQSMNITLIFTCVDCPTSNGLNERLNQTLVNRIRCKINSGDRRTWTKVAEDCINEYNNTIHSSTNFEPSYLLYGTRPDVCPVDNFITYDLASDRQKAFQNSTKNHNRNKNRVDDNRREHQFEVNDLVYIENGSKLNRRKMDKVRLGPFPVLNRISSSFYEVDCGKKRKEAHYFHSSKLSPFFPKKVPGEGEV